jgi:hypothetical protein
MGPCSRGAWWPSPARCRTSCEDVGQTVPACLESSFSRIRRCACGPPAKADPTASTCGLDSASNARKIAEEVRPYLRKNFAGFFLVFGNSPPEPCSGRGARGGTKVAVSGWQAWKQGVLVVPRPRSRASTQWPTRLSGRIECLVRGFAGIEGVGCRGSENGIEGRDGQCESEIFAREPRLPWRCF